MSEDGPTTCERCGGVLRRVLFPSGIIFKGPGFYRNDSRPSTSSSESGSEKAAASAPEGGSGTTKSEKSDTASATTQAGSD